MPSTWHEGAIALVWENPSFSADLMRDVLHIDVPVFTEARLVEAALNELIPAEYHADAVVLLSVDGKPAFGTILDVQLQEDERKRFTWPIYAVNARGKHECPFVLVAVTPDPSTARWAAKTIELGGGRTWAPFVVGPVGIPFITDTGQARKAPELAVLSVMTHRMSVSDTHRERILGCTDLALLDDWLRRAATVVGSAALFD